MNQVLMDGVSIAIDIRNRCRAMKIQVKSVFAEAEVSYLTYKSWRGGKSEPRMRTVKKVYAVVKRHEDEKGMSNG